MHPRGASGHAGETRQAAVDVLDDVGGRRAVLLQHPLDQVDTSTWRIALVTEEDVGWTGRGAKAAVDTAAQDTIRLRDIRVGELREGKARLHRITPRPTSAQACARPSDQSGP